MWMPAGGATTTAVPIVALHGLWNDGSVFFAVGDSRTLLQTDPMTWWAKPASLPVAATTTLRAIWGSSPSDVWIVGDGGTVLHYSP